MFPITIYTFVIIIFQFYVATIVRNRTGKECSPTCIERMHR